MACQKKQARFQEFVGPRRMDLCVRHIKAVQHFRFRRNRQLHKIVGNRCLDERHEEAALNQHEGDRDGHQALQGLTDRY